WEDHHRRQPRRRTRRAGPARTADRPRRPGPPDAVHEAQRRAGEDDLPPARRSRYDSDRRGAGGPPDGRPLHPRRHRARGRRHPALHPQEVLAAVREEYGNKVYDFGVTDSIRFAETPLAGQSILQYARESDGAKAYRALAVKVMENHRVQD